MKGGCDKFKIVVFLASVVTHPARLTHLRELIESMRAQTVKPDAVCISIHVTPELLDCKAYKDTSIVLQNMFRGTSKNDRDLHIMNQKRGKPQFVQYNMLATRMHTWYPSWNIDSTWLVFSDDDDLWNTTRIETYRNLFWGFYNVDCFEGKRKNVSTCIIYETSMHNNPACCNIQTACDVTRAIACGCASQNFASRERFKHMFFEYHRCSTPLRVFNEFLHDFLFYVKHNRFCDVIFSQFLRVYGSRNGREQLGDMGILCPDWSYFYRNGQLEYPCLSGGRFDANALGFESAVENASDFVLQQLEVSILGKNAYKTFCMVYQKDVNMYAHICLAIRKKAASRRALAQQIGSYYMDDCMLKALLQATFPGRAYNDGPFSKLFDQLMNKTLYK